MAIKKCDDTTEATDGSNDSITPDQAPTTSATQNEVSQVKENTYLGKTLSAVENNIYESTIAESFYNVLLSVSTFGNGYIKSIRPSDIEDPLRAEARKFFALNKSGQVVYVNSDLNESAATAVGTAVVGASADTAAYYGPSPITITSLAPAEADLNSVFKKYEQQFKVSSRQFVANNGDSNPPNPQRLANSWHVFVEGGGVADLATASEDTPASSVSPQFEADAREFGPYNFGDSIDYDTGFFNPTPTDRELVLSMREEWGGRKTALGTNILDASGVLQDIMLWAEGRQAKEDKMTATEIIDTLKSHSTWVWDSKKYYDNDYVGRMISNANHYTKEFPGSAYVDFPGPFRAVVYFFYDYERQTNFDDKINSREIILEIFSPQYRQSETTITTPQGSLLSRPSPLIDVTRTFTDHYTNIVIPFSQEELERYLNNVNNPAYAQAQGKYNFYSTGYEDYIKSADIKEYQLQNQFSNITREASYIQKSLFEFGVDLSYIKNVQALQETQGFDITEKYQNIGIPSSQVSEIKKVTDTDDLYPMINTIELSTNRTGQFLISADEAGMTDNLLKHIMDQTIIYPNERVSAASNNGLDFVVSNEQVVFTNGETIIETSQKSQIIPLIDLGSWISSYFSKAGPDALNSAFSDIAILLGVDPNAAEESDECKAFANTLKALILSGKINNIVDDNFRTFEEMLQGKEAYNEALVYEIVKWTSDENYLQRIFIPNTEELDLLKYIDTQIKYDKQYKYIVYVHQLIVGTKYSYSGYNAVNTTPASVDFAVEYSPSLQIARFPIFNQSTRVLDSAPVFPDVNIIPYKGVATRLLINLNSNIGDYDLQPIIINDTDQEFADKYREARGLLSTDPIKFKSDDPVSHFEIYRTATPPQSYNDFTNQLLAILSTPDATSVSYIDKVEPNTKYYYTFRSIDIHGNRSNPTDVYMAELVQFEGMIFFNTQVYNFGEVTYDNVKTSRDFRRYFKINPNLIQSLINYDQSIPDGNTESAYNASSISLGLAEEPVWEKRFKMRVTSKNSGKKFDINFTCKVDYTRPSDKPGNPAAAAVSIPKTIADEGLTQEGVTDIVVSV